MEEDRRKLKDEVDELKKTVLRDKQEINGWRSSYKDLLEEKVELAERLSVSGLGSSRQ